MPGTPARSSLFGLIFPGMSFSFFAVFLFPARGLGPLIASGEWTGCMRGRMGRGRESKRIRRRSSCQADSRCAAAQDADQLEAGIRVPEWVQEMKLLCFSMTGWGCWKGFRPPTDGRLPKSSAHRFAGTSVWHAKLRVLEKVARSLVLVLGRATRGLRRRLNLDSRPVRIAPEVQLLDRWGPNSASASAEFC